MKRNFKKPLALLLSALMIIAVMPITALADDAIDVSKLATPSFSTVPYHCGDQISEGAYSNVVYSPSWGTSWSGDGSGDVAWGVGRIDVKIAAQRNAVLVYDGAHDVIAPVVLETKANDTNNSSFIVHYAACKSSLFELRQQWNGYGRTWDQWPAKNIESTDKFSFNTTDGNESSDSQRDGSSRFWWNKLYYKGSGNTDTYYDVDTNIQYDMRTSYKTTSRQNKYGTVTSLANYYVINYKPIYDILSDARMIANEINTNGWKYTTASLNAAVTALNAVGNCNPNKYDFSSDTAGTVAQCATDIKNAKAAYDAINLQKKTFTVNFKTTDGTSTIDSRSITAGDGLGTLPANTAVAKAGTTHHNVYSWDSSITAATVVQADTTYNEIATETECTFTAGTPVATTEDEHGNGYTPYTCACGNSYKSYDAQNFDAYDAAVLESDSLKADETYTADSRANYATAVDAEKIDKSDETLSPTAIANAAVAIAAAKSLLVAVPAADNTYDLTLDDNIEVNFDIDTEFYGADNVEVEFVTTTDENGTIAVGKETAEYPAASAGKTEITMAVAPAQIAEPYVIRVKDSNDVVKETITTSIEDYCTTIINGEFDAKDKEVARGLLDYGAAANAYFSYAGITSTEDYEVRNSDDYDTYMSALDINDIKAKAAVSFTPGVDASGKSISITGVSYLALLDPEFRFYVSQTNEVWAALTEVSITDVFENPIDGVEAKMVKTDNGHCVRVTGLKASDFGKTFKITIGTAELTYNGYTFLYTALSKSNDNNLKNLAKGAYRYASACEAKFA